jgi:predicted signal transduction protein with EAL and GGDEF domain
VGFGVFAGEGKGGDLAVAPRVDTRRRLSATRTMLWLAALAVGATVICGGVGFVLARHSDDSHANERREALRSAISEFRAQIASNGEIDPRFVRVIAQSSGLKDLKLETEPGVDNRDSQPLIDSDGRIVGFFTWERDWPMTAAVNRLMPWLAAFAFALAGFAGFSLRRLERARNALALSEERARRAAEEDPLTGLPNAARILAALDAVMLDRIGQATATYALLALDGLDSVRDQVGEQGVGELIAAVGQKLAAVLPADGILGHCGGGTFAVILHGDSAQTDLAELVASIARPDWLDIALPLGVHAGYAQTPRDAATRDELVCRAQMAVQAAAKKGAGTILAYDHAIDAAFSEQQFIRRELPRAIAAGALDLHYQPIVAADGGRIVGVEALLRWRHPERGAIGPAVFVPVAEQIGLMEDLGAFVLRRALVEAKRWPSLYIAVNLSPLQVKNRGIVDFVRDMLAQTGVEGSRLILEITEGVLIDNPDETAALIQKLRALGVRIALDDFGSGYSNLGYLQRFPFDKLKIDRSFVTALGKSANGSVIIQAIVALGRALGVSVLVEGVETEEQRVLLRLAGCDEMQGFLFARPAAAKAIDRLLMQHKKKARPAALAAAS